MEKIAACLAIIAASSALASAQIIETTSATAPIPGVDDIYQLVSDGSVTNNSSTAVWVDQPGQGQSFTTLSAAGGYQLNSITIDANGTGGNGFTGNLILDIGTYSGGVLTVTNSYTASSGTDVSSINGLPNNLYITFTFTTPITLAANTTYGFAVGSTGAGLLLAQNSSSTYLGGTAFSTSPNNGLNGAISGGSANGFNRVFDVSLTVEAVPEPSTWALMLGGLVALVMTSRRRATRSHAK